LSVDIRLYWPRRTGGYSRGAGATVSPEEIEKLIWLLRKARYASINVLHEDYQQHRKGQL
jgi:hypothetical protein